MKKLVAHPEKPHLLQAIDHKVHHLHIPGKKTIGGYGVFYRVPKCLDEEKVWYVWFFPPRNTIFTDSEKYHLVDKQKSVKIHQNLVEIENQLWIANSCKGIPNCLAECLPNGLLGVLAKCPKRSRRVSDSEYLLSIKWQQWIVTKIHIYWDLEA